VKNTTLTFEEWRWESVCKTTDWSE